MLAGQEGQVDWAHFGKRTVGRPQRYLWAFVMMLAYYRMRFLGFGLRAAMPSFLRGHVESFRFFTAAPRVVLYDNLKSAVLEREGDAVRFHPTLPPTEAAEARESGPTSPSGVAYLPSVRVARRAHRALFDIGDRVFNGTSGPTALSVYAPR